MKLVIISGRSGSGKSTALKVLEDAGYYCIDNLPASLLPDLVFKSLDSNSPEHQQLAVCIDARNATADITRFSDILQELPHELPRSIIYLDAQHAALIKRFSETRRKHPLSAQERVLKEALIAERTILEPISRIADLIIDSSEMNIHQLKDAIRKRVLKASDSGMSLLFQSFGFKRGVPLDSDLVFDVRCLPNPYWHHNLRKYNGTQPEITEFLEKEPLVKKMLNDIIYHVAQWLPEYEKNNRAYLTVSVGCTGGQHRSVYLCEQLQQHFSQIISPVNIYHRELTDAEKII